MTTSNDYRTPPIAPSGDHWLELTATLCPESTEQLSDWIRFDLEELESDLDSFVTRNSRRRSLGRQSQKSKG